MYYKDHNPPHFHAQYNEDEVQINIQTLEIIKGRLSPKAIAIVMERALLHQEDLMNNRDKAKNEYQLEKIMPLQ